MMSTVGRRGGPDEIHVISHAHARQLAECWQDAERAHHPITVLARSGEITRDAEPSLRHDLRLLEAASATWGNPRSIPEKQLEALLGYVLHHGPRPPVADWDQHRDADFISSIRRMALAVRRGDPTGGPSLDGADLRGMGAAVVPLRARRTLHDRRPPRP